MIRTLIPSAQFLAEVPTNEQGYPSNTVSMLAWEQVQYARDLQQCWLWARGKWVDMGGEAGSYQDQCWRLISDCESRADLLVWLMAGISW